MSLVGCGSGGGEDDKNNADNESTTNSSSSTSSTSSSIDAECYFVPGANGVFINVGAVGEELVEEVVARTKSDIFIASCTGDVDVTIDNSSTVTATDNSETTN